MEQKERAQLQGFVDKLFGQPQHHRHGSITMYLPMGSPSCLYCSRRKRGPNRRARDSQKKKLYASEDKVDAKTPDLESMLYVKLFADKVVGSAYYRKHYGHMTVDVRDGRRRRSACASGGYNGHGIIRMPRWSRSKMIVLHELSHLAVAYNHKDVGVTWHGREFARIYLDLVRHVLGDAKAEELKASFKAHGVKYKPKRAGGNRKGNADALRKWREARKLVA